MKKAITFFFLISYLLSTPSLMTREICVKASPVTLAADSITVIVPDNYTTIQEAINNASLGATIFVRNGTYYEHVVINKTITLVGEDSEFTIINGSETNNVIWIRANNVTVENFTVTKSGMYPYSGILVDHSMGCIIRNNKVIYNYEGINLLYSSSNVVCGNTISNNYDGILFYPSSNNMVSGNMIFSNNYDGILFYSSSNNMVSGNMIFSNNYDGILFYSSSNNMVSGNMIFSNNYDGMSLYYSGNNIVCGNTMLSNYPGIDLDSSSANNTIYHNNFNNTDQARSESENVWSYGDEGNYWSDYTGQDLNKDGIGDTSYDINVANKDNYPLMGMFYEYSITLKGETYNVTVISNSTISIFRFQIGAETGNKILRFNATGKDGTSGFCRAKIPIGLMNYPYIVLVDSEEIFPTVLNVSNEAYAYLYFTYLNENNTIGIISSKTLALYFELLDEYVKLHKDLYDLNETYYTLLENYNILLLNFSALIENYNSLLYNYTQLQVTFHDLNDSYLKHLLDYSEQMQNIRNLTYILVALTAILIITTIYLSKRAHANVNTKIKAIEGK